MANRLVLYYSKTGNSKFLAVRLAQALGSDIAEIKPLINHSVIVFLLSLLRLDIGMQFNGVDPKDYDEIIIIGPIWGGQLITPLRSAIKKCVKANKPIHFAVSCETSDEVKDDQYGYTPVLKAAEDLGKGLVHSTVAFPMTLVGDDDQHVTHKFSDRLRLTAENFNGPLKVRLETYTRQLQSV